MTNKFDLAIQILHFKPKLWTWSIKFLCKQSKHKSTETFSSNEPINDKTLLQTNNTWNKTGKKLDASINPNVTSTDDIQNDTTVIKDSLSKSTLEPSSKLASIGTSIPSKQIHKVSLSNQIEGHVARQLSRHKISPEEQKAWEHKASKFKLHDHIVPSIPTISLPAPFEVAALQKIHKLSFTYNTIFEVRDATVPCSSHHPSFSRLAYHRKHLICYTHADVLDEASIKRVADWTRKSWPKAEFRFVDTREQRADPAYFQDIRDWLINAVKATGGTNCALTVGMPNVGKSSVLLGLMRSQGNIKTRVGENRKLKKGPKPSILNVPGHTKELTQYALQETPRLYCLDVPGIPAPKEYFHDLPEKFWALRAAGIIGDYTINNEIDYADENAAKMILHFMNRDHNFGYVKKLGLDEPTNDINVCLNALDKSGEKRGKSIASFLKLLRTGNFGPVVLDDLSKPWVKWAKKLQER